MDECRRTRRKKTKVKDGRRFLHLVTSDGFGLEDKEWRRRSAGGGSGEWGRRYHRELSVYEEEEQRGETSARCQRGGGGGGGGKKSGGTGDKSVTGFRQNSDGLA